MVSWPPPGELIVTPLPVPPIDPIVIGCPWSARIEFARPTLCAIEPARDWKLVAPVTRARNPNRRPGTRPRCGDRNLGAVPGGRYAVVAAAEPGCWLAPSTADRFPLSIPVTVASTPGLAPVLDWPW